MPKKSITVRRRNNNHLTPEQLQARRAAAHSGTLATMAMLKSVAATPKVLAETPTPRPLTAVAPGTPWYAGLPQFARYNRETSPST